MFHTLVMPGEYRYRSIELGSYSDHNSKSARASISGRFLKQVAKVIAA
jgi:hypothetical protein